MPCEPSQCHQDVWNGRERIVAYAMLTMQPTTEQGWGDAMAEELHGIWDILPPDVIFRVAHAPWRHVLIQCLIAFQRDAADSGWADTHPKEYERLSRAIDKLKAESEPVPE
jgi:hypothetical protein